MCAHCTWQRPNFVCLREALTAVAAKKGVRVPGQDPENHWVLKCTNNSCFATRTSGMWVYFNRGTYPSNLTLDCTAPYTRKCVSLVEHVFLTLGPAAGDAG